jgi:hypothetical protein
MGLYASTTPTVTCYLLLNHGALAETRDQFGPRDLNDFELNFSQSKLS